VIDEREIVARRARVRSGILTISAMFHFLFFNQNLIKLDSHPWLCVPCSSPALQSGALAAERGLHSPRHWNGGETVHPQSEGQPRKISLPPCDTLLLVRAAEIVVAERVRLRCQTAAVIGTARFTRLVSQELRAQAATLSTRTR